MIHSELTISCCCAPHSPSLIPPARSRFRSPSRHAVLIRSRNPRASAQQHHAIPPARQFASYNPRDVPQNVPLVNAPFGAISAFHPFAQCHPATSLTFPVTRPPEIGYPC